MKSERISAGLVMYRKGRGELEIFLAHPGGPFFAHKNEGHWTIPKGEPNPGEDLLAAAIREFQEEAGHPSTGPYLDLGCIRQKGGKLVYAWGFEGDWDDSKQHVCNTFKMEWPPLSGHLREFPEIDRVQFFPYSLACRMIKETQRPLLERLKEKVGI